MNEIRKIRDISLEQPAPLPKQLSVRSGLRAGAAPDCSLGLRYWKSEYQRLKQLAKSLGCI